MPFHPIDQHVGSRMRQRRALLGMSQSGLAAAVGLTFQQIQKYESGFNRIAASRLVEFAHVLDVAPGYFFDEIPSAVITGLARRKGKGTDKVDEPVGLKQDPMLKRETLELVRAYYKIHEVRIRRQIRATVKVLGNATEHEASSGRGKAQRKQDRQ